MSQQWAKHEWHDTLRKLYDRSATDPEFRKLCIQDSDAAIREISGKEPPAGPKIRFVNKLEEHIMVLPRPVTADEELTEEELSAVAGGIVLSAWTDWRDSDSKCCGPVTEGSCFSLRSGTKL